MNLYLYKTAIQGEIFFVLLYKIKPERDFFSKKRWRPKKKLGN